MSASTHARLLAINASAARRYANLQGAALVEATTALDRYLDACRRLGVDVEVETIREIVATATRPPAPAEPTKPAAKPRARRAILPGKTVRKSLSNHDSPVTMTD